MQLLHSYKVSSTWHCTGILAVKLYVDALGVHCIISKDRNEPLFANQLQCCLAIAGPTWGIPNHIIFIFLWGETDFGTDMCLVCFLHLTQKSFGVVKYLRKFLLLHLNCICLFIEEIFCPFTTCSTWCYPLSLAL